MLLLPVVIRSRHETGGANVKSLSWPLVGAQHQGGCKGDAWCRAVLHGTSSLAGNGRWTDIYTFLTDWCSEPSHWRMNSLDYDRMFRLSIAALKTPPKISDLNSNHLFFNDSWGWQGSFGLQGREGGCSHLRGSFGWDGQDSSVPWCRVSAGCGPGAQLGVPEHLGSLPHVLSVWLWLLTACGWVPVVGSRSC